MIKFTLINYLVLKYYISSKTTHSCQTNHRVTRVKVLLCGRMFNTIFYHTMKWKDLQLYLGVLANSIEAADSSLIN